MAPRHICRAVECDQLHPCAQSLFPVLSFQKARPRQLNHQVRTFQVRARPGRRGGFRPALRPLGNGIWEGRRHVPQTDNSLLGIVRLCPKVPIATHVLERRDNRPRDRVASRPNVGVFRQILERSVELHTSVVVAFQKDDDIAPRAGHRTLVPGSELRQLVQPEAAHDLLKLVGWQDGPCVSCRSTGRRLLSVDDNAVRVEHEAQLEVRSCHLGGGNEHSHGLRRTRGTWDVFGN